MAVTISTHMDTEVATEHCRRNRKVTDKEPHIDPNGYYENWIDVNPREMYERLFGEAVKEYNAKQKREERKIRSYYNEVAKSARKHPIYEEIIGVYGDEVDFKTARAILKEYVQEWQKVNPNMIICGAYLHADEDGQNPEKGGAHSRIHCYIHFIPIAHGYKNGLSVQNSISKGLEQQGIHRGHGKTAQEIWTRSENDRLEHICNRHGLEVIHPQRDQNVEHKSVELYKVEKSIEQKKGELQQTKKAVRHAQTELQAVQRFNDQRRSQLQKQQQQLEKEIEKQTAKLEQLQSEIREHSDQSERLQVQMRQAESRLSDLKAKAKAAEARLAEAQKQAEAAEKLQAVAEDLRNNAINHLAAMNAADLFQWSEDKLNSRTGKTLLQSYCEDQGIDYSWIIEHSKIKPNPEGGYEATRER